MAEYHASMLGGFKDQFILFPVDLSLMQAAREMLSLPSSRLEPHSTIHAFSRPSLISSLPA